MINLLPQTEKNIIKNTEKEKIILILEIISLFFFICLSLSLFAIKIRVSGQVEAEKIILEQEKKEFSGSKVKNIPDNIILINKSFSELKNFYQKQFSVIEILEKVSRTIPEGVYLNIFSYNNNDSNVLISGLAKTQEQLYVFRQNLQQEKDFQDINFPRESWIQKNDIIFNISFKLKNEKGI